MESGQRAGSGEPSPAMAHYGSMTTSDDQAVPLLHALLQVCRDSVAGYATAERDVPDARLWREFDPYRKQRERMLRELEHRVRDLRGDANVMPSAASALHREWMELRAATESNPNHAILAEVDRAERFAVTAYRQALKEHDLDPTTRRMIERHYEWAQAAHDRVRQLLEREPQSRL